MAYLTERKYSFVSTGLDSDTFAVVDFTGEEGLSQTYHFEIMLVTDNADIDLGSVLKNPAQFTIHRDEGDDVDFHGILSNFEQLHEVDEHVFYRATLVPKLWWLTLTHHNQVFLDKNVKEMVEEVLKDGGLTTLDYEFRLQGQYQKNDFVCQYGETHLNFISRWLEREGIYYYFEQAESGEKVIFTDTAISHTDSPNGGSLHYSPPSGLGEPHRKEIIQGFICRYNTLPGKIRLKDYNYRKPSLEMTGSAVVDENGRGEVYYYGEHFRTPEEGNRLAKIRAHELLCRKEEFIGDSTVPYIQTGYTFTLQDHYRGGFNRKYLTIQMTHEGSQTGYLISGIMKGLSEREERVYYQNHFTAIPASVQFRPQRTAEKPKISGTIHGKIDAAGSGKYAELDDQGRYKVILPFDRSGRKDGKASTFLRMAQPYAGPDHGMHFPLHKGTEVLLTFIEGNPDRPIINGAVPNPEAPSPITAENQTMSQVCSGSQNRIAIEDKEGSERILMHTPNQKSFIRIGQPNDPATWKFDTMEKDKDNFGIHLATDGLIDIEAATENRILLGDSATMIVGLYHYTAVGLATVANLAMHIDLKMGGSVEFKPLHHQFREQTITIDGETVTVGGSGVKITGGTTTVTGNKTKVTGDNTTVTGDNTMVRGDDTRVTGNLNTVIGDKSTVMGTVTSVNGEKTTVTGNVTNVTGDNTTVSGDVNEVSGDHNTLSGIINMM